MNPEQDLLPGEKFGEFVFRPSFPRYFSSPAMIISTIIKGVGVKSHT